MKTTHFIIKHLLKFEHTIYCVTNCRVELPLHRKYYEIARKKFYEAKKTLPAVKYLYN